MNLIHLKPHLQEDLSEVLLRLVYPETGLKASECEREEE